MRFALTRRIEFVPSLWPTLALVLLLPCLIFLGIWQLHRAGEKEAQQLQKAARASVQPRSLTGKRIEAKSWNHTQVIVQGRYDSKFQILLDNRIHKGRPGFYVITPLKIDGSETRVLVNRGWIPLGKSRADFPMIDSPAGDKQVSGRARLSYSDRYKLGAEPAKITKGMNIWQTLEIEGFEKLVPYEVQPVIIELDARTDAGVFLREWVTRAGSPASRNIGYAVQWFALAGLLLGLYLFLNIRKTNV